MSASVSGIDVVWKDLTLSLATHGETMPPVAAAEGTAGSVAPQRSYGYPASAAIQGLLAEANWKLAQIQMAMYGEQAAVPAIELAD